VKNIKFTVRNLSFIATSLQLQQHKNYILVFVRSSPRILKLVLYDNLRVAKSGRAL